MLVYGRVARRIGFLLDFYERIPKIGVMQEEEIAACVTGEFEVLEAGTEGRMRRVAYAVFFGRDSQLNFCGFLPMDIPQHSPATGLYAVKMVLQSQIIESLNSKPSGKLRKVVIMTHSGYLAQTLAQNVWKWEEKGYKTARKQGVVNEGLIKEIHAMILGMEEQGVGVEFWRVERKENKRALALAESMFAEGKKKECDEEGKREGKGKQNDDDEHSSSMALSVIRKP